MKTLIFEDINLETHFAYEVYRYSTGSGTSYLVYEVDPDGHMKCIKEFASKDDAVTFARNKCK